MSHEALKFNVICNDCDNLQPIVGSVDFHTFHMVYMRIIKVEEEVDNGVTYYHYTVDFYLQNYDGEISIGFEGEPVLTELSEKDKADRVEKIKTLVKGFDKLSKQEQAKILEMHRVDFILDVPVKPFDTDCELTPVKLDRVSKKFNGHILETNVVRQTPDATYYNPKDPLNSKYLNPYHYKRAGDELLEVGLRNKGSKMPFKFVGNAGTLLSRCNPSRSYFH